MMTKKQRLLVVEDEEPIRVGLEDLFVFHGFEVESAADGPTGLRLASSGRFDLILLDVMLPGMDGFEICNRVRERDPEQPIIMLTAKGADADIIQGLRLGADDYVSKPFSVTQLVLRVQAVLRRSKGAQDQQGLIQIGEMELDSRNLVGLRAGVQTPFTRREIDLLGYLAAHCERPVPRDELLHKVWGYSKDAGLETRTVDIHIAKLRRKIELDPVNPVYLVTVRGAGYRLLMSD